MSETRRATRANRKEGRHNEDRECRRTPEEARLFGLPDVRPMHELLRQLQDRLEESIQKMEQADGEDVACAHGQGFGESGRRCPCPRRILAK
jgi:hypothetical protein